MFLFEPESNVPWGVCRRHDHLRGSEFPCATATHLEAVYRVAGRCGIEVKEAGEGFEIETGTVYALDHHDEHILCAETEMRMVCVFNPPPVGPDLHDGSGLPAARPRGYDG